MPLRARRFRVCHTRINMRMPPIPTIPISQLLQELSGLPADCEISFSGLTFYRVKQRGEKLAQIEFAQQVFLDEQGRVVVQNLG